MERQIKEGSIYRHFKGNLYKVLHIATNTEDNEQVVVYEALYGDHKVWVRPYYMFASEVDHDKYPTVTQKYRFEEISA